MLCMKPWVNIALGSALLVVGALLTALYTGILFIADCSAQCRARGEHLIVIGLIAMGLAIVVAGVWLIRRGTRAIHA